MGHCCDGMIPFSYLVRGMIELRECTCGAGGPVITTGFAECFCRKAALIVAIIGNVNHSK